MKLVFLLLVLIITSSSYGQESQEWTEPVMEDYTPTDRPVVDSEDEVSEAESTEVSNYDYDY